MTALELLESLNLLDETERIEAKRASEAGKSILETICAFANEPALGGGWLLLGVMRDEQAGVPSYKVEGISQPEKLSTEIATQCRSCFNQPVRVEISTQALDSKTVLVLHVPEAQPQDKPVFFRAQGLPKGAFRRISSTDQHCTDDDLAVFYQGRQSESLMPRWRRMPAWMTYSPKPLPTTASPALRSTPMHKSCAGATKTCCSRWAASGATRKGPCPQPGSRLWRA